MRSMGQICIKDLHDVTPSETAPEDPITGQIWIDISTSPPVTKVWNGTEWVLQNDAAKLREAIDSLISKNTELRERIAELDAYSGAENDSIAILNNRIVELESRLASLSTTVARNDVSAVEEELEAIRGSGRNEITNSSGMYGFVGWSSTGIVTVDTSIDTRLNTTSGSCFKAESGSTLSKKVTDLRTDCKYALSFRAKLPDRATVLIELYAGGRCVHAISALKPNIWNDVEYVFDEAPDGTIEIMISHLDGAAYFGDFVLTVGNRPRRWTPHPEEFLAGSTRVDKAGLAIEDGTGGTVTVSDTGFVSLKNDTECAALDAEGLRAKTVRVTDSDTVRKLLIVPCSNASDGADIYLLD